MTTKFPKALAAAGLAAALVGCGSSNEAARTPDPAPAPQPRPPVPANPGPTEAERLVMAWQDGFDDYDLSPDMTDLPDDVEITTMPGSIELEYDGDEESGDRVRGLPNGWTGREYEIEDRAFTAYGRVFTNHHRDEGLEYEWNDLADLDLFGPAVTMGDDTPAVVGGAARVPGRLTITTTTANDDVTTQIFRRDITFSSAVNTQNDQIDIGEAAITLTNGLPTTGIAGTLFGLSGHFTCSDAADNAASNACEVSFDERNRLRLHTSLPADVLVFVLDDPSIDAELSRPDSSFVEFGYWATVNHSDMLVEIDTFARVEGEQDLAANPGGITGSADYEGPAAGYYILNQNNALHNGEFTADVELSVDFDDNEIDGEISDFESATNSGHDLSDWELDLEEADFSTTNTDRFERRFRGNTSYRRGGVDGEWEGRFFGNAGMNTPGDSEDDYPQSVVGEFTGDFGNGNQVIGVFGTEYQD